MKRSIVIGSLLSGDSFSSTPWWGHFTPLVKGTSEAYFSNGEKLQRECKQSSPFQGSLPATTRGVRGVAATSTPFPSSKSLVKCFELIPNSIAGEGPLMLDQTNMCEPATQPRHLSASSCDWHTFCLQRRLCKEAWEKTQEWFSHVCVWSSFSYKKHFVK